MNKDVTITLFFLFCCILLVFIPTGFETSRSADSYLEKAEVLSVDNEGMEHRQIVYTGTQDVEIELESGPHKGSRVLVVNPLSGKMEYDEIYKPGDHILVEYKLHEGKINLAFTRGYYRLNHELLLVALFAVLLFSVAGFTGLKALLSFAFAGLMIWKVLVPLFMKDIAPIPVSLAVTAALTGSVSFLVGGWTKKGLTCFLGAFSGLILTWILAKISFSGFHLNGAVRPYTENLFYTGYAHLDFNGIFLSGIFLACSGAVMDLAMDIAASIAEIKKKKSDISPRELFVSGMAVGRSVVGTMTTTLLLAYSGGYIALLMNFMGLGYPLEQILNINFVSAEVLNTLVGSFGLVAVAPLTAAVGALLYSHELSFQTLKKLLGRKDEQSGSQPIIKKPAFLRKVSRHT